MWRSSECESWLPAEGVGEVHREGADLVVITDMPVAQEVPAPHLTELGVPLGQHAVVVAVAVEAAELAMIRDVAVGPLLTGHELRAQRLDPDVADDAGQEHDDQVHDEVDLEPPLGALGPRMVGLETKPWTHEAPPWFPKTNKTYH